MLKHKCRSRNCCDLSAYENRHRQHNYTAKKLNHHQGHPINATSSEPASPPKLTHQERCLLYGRADKCLVEPSFKVALREALLRKKDCKRKDDVEDDDVYSMNSYLHRFERLRMLPRASPNSSKSGFGERIAHRDVLEVGPSGGMTQGRHPMSPQSGHSFSPTQPSYTVATSQFKPQPSVPEKTYKFPDGYKHPQRKRWTLEQLKATDGIIPCQMGTNQFASQKGMSGFGTFRNTTTPIVADGSRSEPTMLLPSEYRLSDAIIPLQYGTNQFASQRGMTGFGAFRDVTGKHIHSLIEDELPGVEYFMDDNPHSTTPFT